MESATLKPLQTLPSSLESPMKIQSSALVRTAVIGTLLLLAGAAQAHTGHGTASLFEGMAHPLGLDHWLAMVAVGLWSVSVLPAQRAWWGPATFMLALVVSAALGAAGLTVPFLEHLISLSVVLFGIMLVLASHKGLTQKMPLGVGLALIALAASLHGLAHGAEAPGADSVLAFAAYAGGFLLTTATLHAGGVLAALGLRRTMAERATWALTGLGALFGTAGMYLFSQM
jgi:urease accessory protein